jgi:hypothetical protein
MCVIVGIVAMVSTMSLVIFQMADLQSVPNLTETSANIEHSETPPPVGPPVEQKVLGDPTLTRVVNAWATLPAAIRVGILAMVDAASPKGGAP